MTAPATVQITRWQMPCASCGKRMQRNADSLPPGQATCYDCRREQRLATAVPMPLLAVTEAEAEAIVVAVDEIRQGVVLELASRHIDLAAQRTTCHIDGCLVLLDEVCPACTARLNEQRTS